MGIRATELLGATLAVIALDGYATLRAHCRRAPSFWVRVPGEYVLSLAALGLIYLGVRLLEGVL